MLNGLNVFLQYDETVLDDDDVDEVFGGSDSDWFLYDPRLDDPADKSASEPLN